MICKIVPQEAIREVIAIPLAVLMETVGPNEFQRELTRVSEYNIQITQELRIGKWGECKISFCYHPYVEGSSDYVDTNVGWAHFVVGHSRRNIFYFIRSWIEGEKSWRLDLITDNPGGMGLTLVDEVQQPC